MSAATPALRRKPLPAPEPPALRALTVDQIEALHPGCAGRVRQWIKRCDARDVEFLGLRLAIIRIGRSVLVDEIRFRNFLYERSAAEPATARNRAAAPARRGRRTA